MVPDRGRPGQVARSDDERRPGYGGSARHARAKPETVTIATDKITPFLWFDGRAEEAARFYVSLFAGSEIEGDDGAPDAGPARSVTFRLAGRRFIAFDGGPRFAFTPAISFFVRCESQAEIDTLWDRLCDGGEPGRCGWLTDRFGVSWQIVPTVLGDLLGHDDDAVSQRVLDAMLAMTELDVAGLRAAADGAR